MKIFCIASILLVSLSAHVQNTASDGMETLRSLLKAGTVKKIEILRLPDEVLTRSSVTPDALRSMASYEVIFNTDLESIFGSLLSETSATRTNQNSDLRWGILFYGDSGQEVGSIFVDRFGEKGYLNKEPVLFGSNMARRLRQIIRDLR